MSTEMSSHPTDQAETATSALDVTHRRNRMAGLWAAELLGLMGHAAQDYVRQVMHPGHDEAELHGDDQDNVIRRLAGDLAGRASLAEIRTRMAHFLSEARRQLGSDKE